MQLRQLLHDEEGVSPVIGVILMVAITVILAAVIATFVLGLGEQVSETSPNANWESDFNDTTGIGDGATVVEITHTGGDQIESSNLRVTGWANGTWGQEEDYYFDPADDDKTLTAGESVDVNTTNSPGNLNTGDSQRIAAEDDELRLAWENEEGASAVLQNFRVPDNYNYSP